MKIKTGLLVLSLFLIVGCANVNKTVEDNKLLIIKSHYLHCDNLEKTVINDERDVIVFSLQMVNKYYDCKDKNTYNYNLLFNRK